MLKWQQWGWNAMNIDIDITDYTIILNALHYYKKVEKRGNFKQYDEERINQLRDKIAKQIVPTEFSYDEFNFKTTE